MLAFDTNAETGRFAVMVDGRVAFETYHLGADERAKLKGAIQAVDESAWATGHDTAVILVREFAASLHIVRTDR